LGSFLHIQVKNLQEYSDLYLQIIREQKNTVIRHAAKIHLANLSTVLTLLIKAINCLSKTPTE